MKERSEKELLDRVQELEEILKALMECSRDGLTFTDRDGNFIWWNKRLEEIHQVTPDRVTSGKDMKAHGVISYSSSAQALKEGRMVTVLNTTPSGKQVLSTSIPIFNNEGVITGAVGTIRDLSEIKELESKLIAAELALRQTEYQLSEIRKEWILASHFVSHSPRMREVVELTRRVMDLDAGVLITGETGVGKSVFAEVLHRSGQRKKGPFVSVNCASIPESLLESELFGYEKGAFTGASTRGKPGMFELAQGGTLFLDEISEIPLGLQAKLLDALDRREVRRLGGTERLHLDIRIITATNQDLKKLVEEGSFREDLYYRLDIIRMIIPPLRERGEDILVLANVFLDNHCRKFGRDVRFGHGVDAVLMEYHWPGNVRELENLVLRLVLTSTCGVISADAVASHLPGTDGGGRKIQVKGGLPLKEALNQVEVELVQRAMAIHGSTYKAALALGISQSSVVRKMQKLATPRPQ